ncbi:MAG TPA: FkbM family methyltransferase [Gemmatimonadaceae bacterium]|nr:FkbM family methyltransferase [Gemmatimonadaceae bacterium]
MERLKSTVRLIEAAIAQRTDVLPFAGQRLRFIHSRWWNDNTREAFAVEIEPYFAALSPTARYTTIVDAGAAVGQFAVAACVRWPTARVSAFEPSRRQRLLLSRNARLNGLANRIDALPLGLWNESTTLRFRTHGAMSSIASVSMLPKHLTFAEHIPVTTLDGWAAPARIDLIKMDIEGAEIEALQGASGILTRDRPDVIVQAYHQRDGARTFERCAAIVERHGYVAREVEGQPGLLLATPA